jgi:hypothetical protein
MVSRIPKSDSDEGKKIFSCLPFSCLTLRPTGKWKTGKYLC